MEIVPPLIPDAQKNRGPDLFLEGMRGGLAALTQFAQIRRQSESDIARMAFAERQASEEHKFNTAKMAQDYEMRDRALTVEEDLMEPRKNLMEAQAEYHRTTKGAQARQATAKIATLNDFNRQVAKYGLDNPNPQNPAEYYANARRLSDEFGWADIPVIKHTLKDINLRTKEHTIPLTVNQRIKDDDGNVVSEMKTKMVPIGEIIEGLKDPKKYDATMAIIERSGLLDEKASGNKALREAIQVETKRVESGGGTDFRRGKSRVAPGGPLSDPTGGDFPDGEAPVIEDVNESDLFGSIGETEKLLESAMKAIRLGASPQAVAARLRDEHRIDPSRMWA